MIIIKPHKETDPHSYTHTTGRDMIYILKYRVKELGRYILKKSLSYDKILR